MKLTITIPKPCHENWSTMHAREGGRFCDSCQHTVADLTRATDAQLVALFTSDAKPKCARFDPAQLDRALSAAEQAPWAGALPIAAFTTLAAVATGCETIGQQPPMTTLGEMQFVPVLTSSTDTSVVAEPADTTASCRKGIPDSSEASLDQLFTVGQMVAVEGIVLDEPPAPEITLPAHTVAAPRINEMITVTQGKAVVETTVRYGKVEICGIVADAAGEPMPFAEVALSDGSARTYADTSGAFRMSIPVRAGAGTIQLDFNALGYAPLSRSFELPAEDTTPAAGRVPLDAPPSSAVDPKGPLGIVGTVEDEATGRMLPDAIVAVAGTDVRVRCDERGQFGLRIPEDLKGKPVELEVLVENTRMRIPLSAHAVPCCVPVKFKPEPMNGPIIDKPCHDLGLVQMNEGPFVLGDYEVIRRPSARERVTAPLQKAWRKLTR